LYWDGGFAEIDLPPGLELLVGRGADCDLGLDDTSVSRRHAIVRTGPPLTIEDLDSANGTRVDGVPAERGNPLPIRVGSLVEVGEAVIVIRAPEAEPVAAPQDVPANMAQVRELIDRVARGNIPVTLVGETGVGKEVLAERLHEHSPRGGKTFVRINCAALPEQLLESELFGYERGAFTGASQAKAGLLESADGGTVFLDEVGELPKPVQAKLLRALECKEVFRIGALRPRSFDVRFVAATNRDLDAMVTRDEFRPDLFHRLCGVVIRVPALRERPDDLTRLTLEFLEESAKELERKPPEIHPEVLTALEQHHWPGNIRELRHAVQAAVLMCAGDRLERSHLPASVLSSAGRRGSQKTDLKTQLDDVERQRILDALDRCGGNQTRTAKALGIPRRTLIARLDAYGLPRPRKRKG
jgi:transcriptional regulator with PAS, ATPase and Fis domain